MYQSPILVRDRLDLILSSGILDEFDKVQKIGESDICTTGDSTNRRIRGRSTVRALIVGEELEIIRQMLGERLPCCCFYLSDGLQIDRRLTCVEPYTVQSSACPSDCEKMSRFAFAHRIVYLAVALALT